MSKKQLQAFHLKARIKEVVYTPLMIKSKLGVYSFDDLKSGKLHSTASCDLRIKEDAWGFSQWVSPKRTRSFPYARVYDTLAYKNRMTLIPFCKDEGFGGDRDFIQWDTISLMSLLNVHVILGFYSSADKNRREKQKHKEKITNQKYDWNYVARQITGLFHYHSSALHWNLQQAVNIDSVATLAHNAYTKISRDTGVKMHDLAGIERRKEQIANSAENFRKFSRGLAEKAQRREAQTFQPKERTTGHKAIIHISNLLGGEYFLTTDECEIVNGVLFLIEKKHTSKKAIPSESDIKDAFIKMSLFSNIVEVSEVSEDSKQSQRCEFSRCRAAVGLTSHKIKGCLHSNVGKKELTSFAKKNSLGNQDVVNLRLMIREAKENNFDLFIVNSDDIGKRQQILKELAANNSEKQRK